MNIMYSANWGGHREGAGRKKLAVKREQHNIRLTREEYAHIRQALADYRAGKNSPLERKTVRADAYAKRSEQSERLTHAMLLAHLNALLKKRCELLEAHMHYLQDEQYQGPGPAELAAQDALLKVQILALVPHINRFQHTVELDGLMQEKTVEVKMKNNSKYQVMSWSVPDAADFDQENLRSHQLILHFDAQYKKLRQLRANMQW